MLAIASAVTVKRRRRTVVDRESVFLWWSLVYMVKAREVTLERDTAHCRYKMPKLIMLAEKERRPRLAESH